MDMKLAGLRAAITGGASGIGLAVARALIDEGASVLLIDLSPSALAEAVAVCGERSRAVCADVSDEEAMRAVFASEKSLDLLVTCAGISGPMGTLASDITAAQWRSVFDVNVTGTFLAMRFALALLRRSTHAAIVAVASDSAVVVAEGMAPYCASKAAVTQLARAIAVEEHARGVRVNVVSPSVVDTPMSRADLGMADGEFAHAEFPVHSAADIAAEVVFLLSPRSRGINATTLLSDFGYLARSNFPA